MHRIRAGWTRMALALALIGGAAACGGSSSTAPTDSLSGNWLGLGQQDSVSMTLTQSGTTVTGTASLNGGSVATSVSGTVTGTAVSLVLSEGGNSVAYTGAFANPSQVVGSFALTGGATEAITFNRQ